jgi:hypothetical protein
MKKMVLGLTAVAAIATAAISPAEAVGEVAGAPGVFRIAAGALAAGAYGDYRPGTTDRAMAIMGQGIGTEISSVCVCPSALLSALLNDARGRLPDLFAERSLS